MEQVRQKIWFLQIARSFACLLVVYAHWYALISNPNPVHEPLKLDAIPDYPSVYLPDYLAIISNFLHLNHFTSVYFGLGLFFVLSGYIIPLSLKNAKPQDFLIRRIFRIYPTLIVCLTVTILVRSFAHYYLESSMELNFLYPKVILANMLLLRDIMGLPYIENATWTLDIEIHFYLLFFILYYFAIDKKIATFVFLALGLFLGACLCLYLRQIINSYVVNGLTQVFFTNSGYLTFMFVGTAGYYTLSRQWSYFKGAVTLLFLLTVNYYCLNMDVLNHGIGAFIFINHLYAMFFFLLLYSLSQYIPYNNLVNKLADISYPLYLVHGFTGYTFYFLLYHASKNIVFSAVGALLGVFVITVLIHFFIEKPGVAFSKKIINKNFRVKIKPVGCSESI